MRADGAVVCFGELLLRLSAPGAQLLLQTPSLEVACGGAEANVAVSLARFGHEVRMVSALPDNPLGRGVRDELRRHGVDTNAVQFDAGRMGLYFLTPGAGVRAPEVIYDRAGSVFAAQNFGAIAWEQVFAGAGWFHVSGVTAALGSTAAEAVISALSAARRAGLTASFDCNYRARLWEAWRGDAPSILTRAVSEADLMFGDARDASLILGRPFTEGSEFAHAMFAAFPNLKRIAHTMRTEHSADRHTLGAMLYSRTAASCGPAVVLDAIVDRIGGGDAFAAGVIHALRKGWGEADVLPFALAAASLKHATPGDMNLADEGDVRALLSGVGVSIKR